MEDRGLNLIVIDSTILLKHFSGTLSDLLVSNSTIFMKTYGQGALSTISFRGTAATHTKVSWNGVPLNNPMVGQVDFSLIPVSFTDRISLLQGGSSLQNGSGALGGSIILESAPSWGESPLVKLAQGFGSFGTYKSLANIQFGTFRLSVRIKAFREQAKNDFEYYNTENGLWNYEIQESAGYKKHGILGELFYKPGDKHILSLHTWLQNSERNLPAIMSYEGIGRIETQSDNQIRISGIWKYYGNNFRSETILGYTSSGIDYYLANQTGMGLFENYDSRSTVQNTIATYKIAADLSSKMILKSQLNYKYSQANIREEVSLSGYSATRQEIGFAMSLHRELSKDITVFGLIRTEIADKDFSPLMPSFGMEAKIPLLNLNIISNISRNYNLPTLNDLYWIPGGNPDLKPEEGYSGDFSLTHTLADLQYFNLSMTATGYMSYINDWILWRPGEYNYWMAENIAEVFARGLEYSMNGKYQQGEISLSLFGTYSFTRTTNRSETVAEDLSVDKQLIYVPIHKANLTTKAEYRGYHLMTSSNYIGERFTTSSNEETRHTLPGFTLFDIRAGKEIKFDKFNITLQLRINNLFNTDYKAVLSRPMPGRSWEVVVKLEL